MKLIANVNSLVYKLGYNTIQIIKAFEDAFEEMIARRNNNG